VEPARRSDDYSLSEHRHRYAAWCAARAASRKLPGGTNAVMRAALEASSLPSLIAGPAESWPSTAPRYDEAHARWCGFRKLWPVPSGNSGRLS